MIADEIIWHRNHAHNNEDYDWRNQRIRKWAVQILIDDPVRGIKDEDWWFFKEYTEGEARAQARKIIGNDRTMSIGQSMEFKESNM